MTRPHQVDDVPLEIGLMDRDGGFLPTGDVLLQRKCLHVNRYKSLIRIRSHIVRVDNIVILCTSRQRPNRTTPSWTKHNPREPYHSPSTTSPLSATRLSASALLKALRTLSSSLSGSVPGGRRSMGFWLCRLRILCRQTDHRRYSGRSFSELCYRITPTLERKRRLNTHVVSAPASRRLSTTSVSYHSSSLASVLIVQT